MIQQKQIAGLAGGPAARLAALNNGAQGAIPNNTATTITGWTTSTNGGNFDPASGIYTVAELAFYMMVAQIVWNIGGTVTPGNAGGVTIQRSTDGGATWATLWQQNVVQQTTQGQPVFPIAFASETLDPGDKIRVVASQVTGAPLAFALASFSVSMTL